MFVDRYLASEYLIGSLESVRGKIMLGFPAIPRPFNRIEAFDWFAFTLVKLNAASVPSLANASEIR
jgi:hypothetical protein